MDPYERSKLCDALSTKKFSIGDTIVEQGQEGDEFFLIEEGELSAYKSIEGFYSFLSLDHEKLVYKYSPGDYFGELALLRNCPRQASIKADTDGKLIVIDRMTFKRLLGPLEEILKRNTSKY